MQEYNVIAKSSDLYKQLSTVKTHARLVVGHDSLLALNVAKLVAINLVFGCGACGVCNNCQRVEKNLHSDIIVVNKDNILTADINELCNQVAFAPCEASKRVFIISDFSTVTEQAQNKLLKTIEEPNENCYFFLCATTMTTVLPTILSRCVVLFSSPLQLQLLKQALLFKYADNPTLDMAVALSQGTLTKTIAFMDNQTLREDFDIAIEVLSSLKSSKDLAKVSSILIKNKSELVQIVEYIQIIFRDILVFYASCVELIIAKQYMQDILQLRKTYNKCATIRILQALSNTAKRLQQNGNAQSIIDEMLFMILECKYNARAF